MQNLTIYSVNMPHVKAAAALAPTLNLGFNDTIAYLVMLENQINQIYSFDKDFDSIPELQRIH